MPSLGRVREQLQASISHEYFQRNQIKYVEYSKTNSICRQPCFSTFIGSYYADTAMISKDQGSGMGRLRY